MIIVPMKPGAWQQYCNTPTAPWLLGPPLKLSTDGTFLEETFPVQPPLYFRFNYLIAPRSNLNILSFSAVSMTVGVEVVSGTPKFEFLSPTNQCRVGCDPVSARMMLWGKNRNLSDTTNRWWAHSIAWPLAPGKATITVPLDGSQWSGVLGAMGDSAVGRPQFNAVKASINALCITFGGGWFFGHGTSTSGGRAKFQLFDYRVY